MNELLDKIEEKKKQLQAVPAGGAKDSEIQELAAKRSSLDREAAGKKSDLENLKNRLAGLEREVKKSTEQVSFIMKTNENNKKSLSETVARLKREAQ